jgi:Cu(I)/Ag(I) efflux system membrane fusion protein
VKNATVSVLLVGVLGAGFLAGTWYRPRQTVNAAGARPRAVRYYVDPMHPSYTSDRPGVAPDCGMALQPVYDTGDDVAVAATLGGAPGAVTVSPQQAQLIGVRVAAVETAAGSQRLRLYGRVVPDETRVYRVTVGIEGIVREVSTVTTGSLVSKDQWLATFAAPEARAPVQTYLVAVDVVDRATKGAEASAAVEFANAALQQTADRLLTLACRTHRSRPSGGRGRCPLRSDSPRRKPDSSWPGTSRSDRNSTGATSSFGWPICGGSGF